MSTGRWLALAALVTVMSACDGDPQQRTSVPNVQEGTSLQKFMASAGQVQSITVSDIYDREVSDVVIVCAYTPARFITNELGFDWPGARSAARYLSAHDHNQAVIALHDGKIVESEFTITKVLDLCDMDLPSPATIDADTTLPVTTSSEHVWSDGTRYPVAKIKGLGPRTPPQLEGGDSS